VSPVLDTYLGWELLAHRPTCKGPSWAVDIRTADAYRCGEAGASHSCPQAGDSCGHRDGYEKTMVRIVCASCGMVHLISGEADRTTDSTRAYGYGQAPRTVAGLFLYPGEPYLHYGRLATDEPHDFLVTARKVARVEQADVVGQITQGRGTRGAVRWTACAGPDPDGPYGYGRIRWTHADDGHRSVAAAAKWIRARQDEAGQPGTGAGEAA
jgi:hypothetical protein